MNIEFLALWEQMHNPNLKGVEIDSFKAEAGTHFFYNVTAKVDKGNECYRNYF